MKVQKQTCYSLFGEKAGERVAYKVANEPSARKKVTYSRRSTEQVVYRKSSLKWLAPDCIVPPGRHHGMRFRVISGLIHAPDYRPDPGDIFSERVPKKKGNPIGYKPFLSLAIGKNYSARNQRRRRQ